jgi:hypothetical protein
MKLKAIFLTLNISYFLFSCSNVEDIKRPLPNYLIDYYGKCETCPAENFIDLKLEDTILYFPVASYVLDTLNEDYENSRSGLLFSGQGINVVGFGAIYFKNRDSVRTNEGSNISILFNFYNDVRICSDDLFFECGSYLFDETYTPQGTPLGNNDSYGLQILYREENYFVTENGIEVEPNSLLSIPENGFFEIVGKEVIEEKGYLRLCGNFEAELFVTLDSAVSISGSFSLPYDDLIFRGCVL